MVGWTRVLTLRKVRRNWLEILYIDGAKRIYVRGAQEREFKDDSRVFISCK